MLKKGLRRKKGFPVGFPVGSNLSPGHLSKKAKGKGIASPFDVDVPMDNPNFSWLERALCLDDMSFDDLDLDWGSNVRATKARANAAARFRDAFNPTYGPWEEVHDALDDSDLEDSEDLEFFNSSCGGSSWSTSGRCRSLAAKVGECSTSGTQKEALEPIMVSSLRDVFKDQSKTASIGDAVMDLEVSCQSLPSGCGSSVRYEKQDEAGIVMAQSGGKKSHRRAGDKQRKRKVIMGRDFLLVSRTCLPTLDRKFQFFHMPSLSVVEVKVKESTREGSPRAQQDGVPLASVPEVLSPILMDEVPPSLSKCMTAPSQLDLHLNDKVGDVHFNDKEVASSMGGSSEISHPCKMEEDSSHWSSCEFAPATPERVMEEASGIRDLQAKRVAVIWRRRLENPIARCRGHRKQKRSAKMVANCDNDGKGIRGYTRRKRKREMVIEDCHADPHIYRIPQRRNIFY